MNNPWETHPHIWKSEAAYMAFIRGGIRSALWNRYPIKLELIKKKRKRIPNPNPRGKVKEVWGGTCYVCGNDFPQNSLQVDHITGNHSLKCIEDVESFIKGMLFVGEDDLGLICKECHAAKSYAERHGISIEEAAVIKKAIQYTKLSVPQQNKILAKHNMPCNNAKSRREAFEQLIQAGELQ